MVFVLLDDPRPASAAVRPMWYAGGDSWYGEAWTMLHLPYTSMVLSFAVVGAVVSPEFSWVVLAGTIAAYFAGLGIGAHFLDQLPGMGSHYVRHWPARALWTAGLGGVAVGVSIGIVGAGLLREPYLLLFVAVQGICALGYPLAPIFRGVLHRDSVFAISWGSLPCLTSYYVQSGTLTVLPVLLAVVFAAVAVLEIRVSRRSREERRAFHPSITPEETPHGSHGAGFRRLDLILQILSIGTTLVALGLLVGRVWLVG